MRPDPNATIHELLDGSWASTMRTPIYDQTRAAVAQRGYQTWEEWRDEQRPTHAQQRTLRRTLSSPRPWPRALGSLALIGVVLSVVMIVVFEGWLAR